MISMKNIFLKFSKKIILGIVLMAAFLFSMVESVSAACNSYLGSMCGTAGMCSSYCSGQGGTCHMTGFEQGVQIGPGNCPGTYCDCAY
jgi:hypothetical protein